MIIMMSLNYNRNIRRMNIRYYICNDRSIWDAFIYYMTSQQQNIYIYIAVWYCGYWYKYNVLGVPGMIEYIHCICTLYNIIRIIIKRRRSLFLEESLAYTCNIFYLNTTNYKNLVYLQRFLSRSQ